MILTLFNPTRLASSRYLSSSSMASSAYFPRRSISGEICWAFSRNVGLRRSALFLLPWPCYAANWSLCNSQFDTADLHRHISLSIGSFQYIAGLIYTFYQNIITRTISCSARDSSSRGKVNLQIFNLLAFFLNFMPFGWLVFIFNQILQFFNGFVGFPFNPSHILVCFLFGLL